jgi:hypothetical protein
MAGVTVSRRRRRLAHSARDRAIAATWSLSAMELLSQSFGATLKDQVVSIIPPEG